MGKPWTPERKEAARQRALARHNKTVQPTPRELSVEEEVRQRIAEEAEKDTPELAGNAQSVPSNEPEQVTISTEVSQTELLNRALEAIAKLAELQGGKGLNTPELKNGRLTGTLDRFSVDPRDYEDFTGRLADDPALERFGFKQNYELTYKFEVVRYETIDHIWQQEPKITIDLNRKIYDEETGELTNGRYKQFRIVIHEDPATAVWVARNNNIDIDAYSEKDFLNEMRYLQVRDWLRECFMPKKPVSHTDRREMVVNGKIVEYFEVNSEETQKIPFDSLNSKV